MAGAPLFAAEGLRTLPNSAEALGMAGGRLILLDVASVVRTNPATLADIKDSTLTVSLQPWHGKTDFTSPTGVQSSMVQPLKWLGSIFIAEPITDTLTAGIGFSAPFGVSISWPSEGPFKYAGAYDAYLSTYAINPAVGLKINDKVSIGAGLDIYYSRLKLERKYPWFLVMGGLPDGDAKFAGDGVGVGGYLALNYDINDRHHIAVVGRLPVQVDYSGDFEITNIPGAAALRTTPFESEIEHPGSVAVGYAFDVCDRLSIGVDFEWIQNSTHDDLPLNIGANQALIVFRSTGTIPSVSVSVANSISPSRLLCAPVTSIRIPRSMREPTTPPCPQTIAT